MYHAKHLMLAALALLLAAPLAAQQVFRWVDKDGKVHYSDMAPPGSRATQPKLDNNSVEVDKMSYDLKRLTETAPITLYTTESCKDLCDQARNWLKQRKLPFTETVGRNADEIMEIGKKLGGEPKVPSITVGAKPTIGFDSTSWTSVVQAAGYPTTR